MVVSLGERGRGQRCGQAPKTSGRETLPHNKKIIWPKTSMHSAKVRNPAVDFRWRERRETLSVTP